MAVGKFLNPQNDVAFKRIFDTDRNKDILIHFINDMLGFQGKQQIQKVSFLKTSQDPEIASKKQSILDVLCTDQQDRQYIVEMQVAKTRGFEKRAQYYAAKAYTNQLNQSEDYHKLKEVIFLAITDFVMFKDKKEYKSDHVVLDKNNHSRDLKDFSFTFLELPKFNKSIHELNSMVEKWAYFFKHAKDTTETEFLELGASDPVIGRAYQELNRFNWSEIEMNTYEQQEKRERDAQAILANAVDEGMAKGIAQGIAQGIAIGEAKGEAKGKAEGLAEGEAKSLLKVAKNMVAQEIDDALILQATGISKETLEMLKKKTIE